LSEQLGVILYNLLSESNQINTVET
jgi:hypothetical protein